MKKLISTLGIVALLFGTSAAQDATQGNSGNAKMDKYKAMLNEIPDLTEDQRSQLEQIMNTTRSQAEPLRQDMKKVREKIVELKSAENPDLKEIDRLIDQQWKIKPEMEKIGTVAEIKGKSILTPEQSKVLEAQIKEKKENREKRGSEKKAMMKAQ